MHATNCTDNNNAWLLSSSSYADVTSLLKLAATLY
jgi:hypothetical protein